MAARTDLGGNTREGMKGGTWRTGMGWGGNLWPRNRCVPEGRYIPLPKNIIRKGGGYTTGKTRETY